MRLTESAKDFNPRPPRGERRLPCCRHVSCKTISIHALREESDGQRWSGSLFFLHFNPRPPRGERLLFDKLAKGDFTFQSTPSARRATYGQHSDCTGSANFNPRPPRGERPCCSHLLICSSFISIHALREESDPETYRYVAGYVTFQSTPSARRATLHGPYQRLERAGFQSTPSARRATYILNHKRARSSISIHALREESDDGCTPGCRA